MRRVDIAPRPNYRQRLLDSGLVYAETVVGTDPDGKPILKPYWVEDAYYLLTWQQIVELETAANELFLGIADVMSHMMRHPERYLTRMQIPSWRWAAIQNSWEMEKPEAASIYGRFDFSYRPDGPPKVLEFNADTPTSLIEAAVAQWFWFADRNFGPEYTQWNNIHEHLVGMWEYLKKQFIDTYGELPILHYTCTSKDLTYEDRMTVEYIARTARLAGWKTHFVYIEEIRYDAPKHGENNELLNPTTERRFFDQRGKRIRACFKLYPWETLGQDRFGVPCFENMALGPEYRTTWIEPTWKEVLSNKGSWPFMWQKLGNDSVLGRYLLPTFFSDDPDASQLGDYIVKPICGREGKGARMFEGGRMTAANLGSPYDDQPTIHQALWKLPEIGGEHALTTVWMGGTPDGVVATGAGFRAGEIITGNGTKFMPHLVLREPGTTLTAS